MLAKMQTPKGFQTQPTSAAWRFSWTEMGTGSKAFANQLMPDHSGIERSKSDAMKAQTDDVFGLHDRLDTGSFGTTATPANPALLDDRVKKMNQWINSPLRGESISTLRSILNDRVQKQQDSDLTKASH